MTSSLVFEAVNALVDDIHRANVSVGWWDGISASDANVVPAKLALVHSEISEALEGHRKELMDDKLPHRKMVEVELADAVIRIMDLAGSDHKRENRAATGGKKY